MSVIIKNYIGKKSNDYIIAFNNLLREVGIPHFSTLYDLDDWNYDVEIVFKALCRLAIIEGDFDD